MTRTILLTLYLFFLLFLSTTILYNNRCFSDPINDDLTTVNKSLLPGPDVLHKWSVLKDEGGPAFAGSPSWKSYVAFLEKGFRERGLIDIQKESISSTRWFTSDERKKGDWHALYPTVARKIVVSIGVEHLGQLEYREQGDDFLPTGLPEETQIFVQDNDLLIKMAVKAVKDNHLPRTLVQCPPRKGQGMWIGMGTVALKKHIPGYAITAGATAYWSTEARIDKFDKDLAW